MSVPNHVPQRIGDAERDAAVEALQEHHALGRLDPAEFEDRMTKALAAKYTTDLLPLFGDLPEPHPVFAEQQPAIPAPQPFAPVTLDHQDSEHVETPWFAQWWMILVAVGVAALSRGSAGFIVPAMAVWLWVIYPSMTASRRRRAQAGVAAATSGRAALNDTQLSQIRAELRHGNEIGAIQMYRGFTGVDLATARDAVERISHQLGGR